PAFGSRRRARLVSWFRIRSLCSTSFFLFTDSATTDLYTLSLHDALPISRPRADRRGRGDPRGPRRLGSPAERTRVEARIDAGELDRKSTRLNSSHVATSYAVFCLKKKKSPAALPPPLPAYKPPIRARTPR